MDNASTNNAPHLPDDPFANFCGPRALAGLAGITRQHAAAIIRGVQRERGEPSDGESTSTLTLLLALRRFGLVAEPFDTLTLEPTATAAHYLEQLVTTARPERTPLDDARELIEAAPLAEQGRMWHHFHRASAPRQRSLQEMLWTVRDGAQLYRVATSEERGHLVAARFGRVISGDDVRARAYGAAAVIAAWRVFREEDHP